MEALDKGYFYCFELVWRTASALPRFYVGHDLGEILWLSWDFGDGASRSPSRNLGTNLGTVLVTVCSKCPVYATGDYRGFLGSPLVSIGG